ncbi:hypothetical protein RJK70_01955 [Buchnera aphidicola (Pseudoregma panicola)]|uniref:hypothetical protein n=1 Tax=Buchnera aphidicola TaxID=9 RepID=UPI0031B687AD
MLYYWKKKSSFLRKNKFPYKVLQFVLIPKNMDFLNKNIVLRLQKMIDSGFEKEVYELFKNNILNIKFQSMNCIGYSQMWDFINKKITYNEMFEKIFFATKKLVKKQMTWIRSWKNLYFLSSEDLEDAKYKILKVLEKNIYIM